LSSKRLGAAGQRFGEGNVDSKCSAIHFSRKPRLGAESATAVLQSFHSELGVLGIRTDLERHEVCKILAPRVLEAHEQGTWVTY
jgi:hypothetical protein